MACFAEPMDECRGRNRGEFEFWRQSNMDVKFQELPKWLWVIGKSIIQWIFVSTTGSKYHSLRTYHSKFLSVFFHRYSTHVFCFWAKNGFLINTQTRSVLVHKWKRCLIVVQSVTVMRKQKVIKSGIKVPLCHLFFLLCEYNIFYSLT